MENEQLFSSKEAEAIIESFEQIKGGIGVQIYPEGSGKIITNHKDLKKGIMNGTVILRGIPSSITTLMYQEKVEKNLLENLIKDTRTNSEHLNLVIRILSMRHPEKIKDVVKLCNDNGRTIGNLDLPEMGMKPKKYVFKVAGEFHKYMEGEADFKRRFENESKRMIDVLNAIKKGNFRSIFLERADMFEIYSVIKGGAIDDKSIMTFCEYFKAAIFMDKIDEFVEIPDVVKCITKMQEYIPSELIDEVVEKFKKEGTQPLGYRTEAEIDRIMMNTYINNIIAGNSQDEAVEIIHDINQRVGNECRNGGTIKIQQNNYVDLNNSKLAYARVLARKNGCEVVDTKLGFDGKYTLNIESLKHDQAFENVLSK
ncbi:MAG: hypothetical protein A2Y24_06525 [Clostridiales bacterium GWE2_32_10]|nr:MAG: hypothetical protein A2Y24_06525 [Clostridiales bacterium GWE2_32_10]HBY19580.1 hypothetical protein [Clostridiales bacterium]